MPLRKVEGSLAPEDIKKAKAELRQAQKNVRDFIAQTNAEEGGRILVRDPLQEKIYEGEGVNNQSIDISQESGIIESKEVKPMIINSIDSPIEQRHTGKGNPNAINTFGAELNNRQKRLLEQLPEFDSRITVQKDSVNMADLSALTAETGHEFAMFTKKNERLIIRGNESMVNIDVDAAEQLANAGYKWSGHTHPGTNFNCLIASPGDHEVLKRFPQNTSVVYNSKGQYLTFQKE